MKSSTFVLIHFVLTGYVDSNKTIKHILWWTPLKDATDDEGIFDNCKYSNCQQTSNREYLHNITVFDAILFEGVKMSRFNSLPLPSMRSTKQKYVFIMLESAHYYPICNPIYDGFFNWTATYRLDSDAVWRYLEIYDSKNRLIGPKTNMHWKDLKLAQQYESNLKHRFKSKSKAAAWIVSNCYTLSRREIFVEQLQNELNLYGLQVDVYGRCRDLPCNDCYGMLEKDYFFYLAFENSFAEDYVTEKVWRALNYFMIPIVYGGANYTRFLPPDCYLDGKELGVKALAKTMVDVILDPPRYIRFFKWVPYYKYVHISGYRHDMCNLCALLNNKDKVETVSIHNDFLQWYNIDGACPIGERGLKKLKYQTKSTEFSERSKLNVIEQIKKCLIL